MAHRKYHLHDGKRGAALAVRVTPRASRNQITEVLSDGTVKIHLTASPTEGQANEALIKFLAGVLDVAPSRIEIVAGLTGRDKLISVLDIGASDLHQLIIKNIS